MTQKPELGRIRFVPVREVWAHEATSFTPWLLENEDLLGDLLGIEVSLSVNEHKVGDFSLDLLGTNLSNDTPLIVENQLARTDHSHLGQLLTYAGGLEPSTIVWIASEFRDEHRAALDWLNEVTDERTHFFGIVVQAIRIEDSPPAPWLELVVKPNQWSEVARRAAQSRDETEAKDRYRRFWTGFLETQRAKHQMFAGKRPPTYQWMSFKTGVGGIGLGLNVQRKRIYADLWFSGSPEANIARLEHLMEQKDLVEATFGDVLSWEELEGSKATRIGFYGEGSLLDEDSWEASQAWLGDVGVRFARVTELQVFQELGEIAG
jgi:hypothetical protein